MSLLSSSYEVEQQQILSTDFLFRNKQNEIHWYGMVDGEIFQVQTLPQLTSILPEYVLFERQSGIRNAVSVLRFFDCNLSEITFLPFNDWKILARVNLWGKTNNYMVEDPIGKKRVVELSSYPTQMLLYLVKFTKFKTIDDYDKSLHE